MKCVGDISGDTEEINSLANKAAGKSALTDSGCHERSRKVRWEEERWQKTSN